MAGTISQMSHRISGSDRPHSLGSGSAGRFGTCRITSSLFGPGQRSARHSNGALAGAPFAVPGALEVTLCTHNEESARGVPVVGRHPLMRGSDYSNRYLVAGKRRPFGVAAWTICQRFSYLPLIPLLY